MEINIEEIKAVMNQPADLSNTDIERHEANAKSKISLAQLDGLTEFYQLRKKWSTAICWFIISLIAFNIILTGCVGFGWLDFKNYPWFITISTTENFGAIIGLALIVVQFLFNRRDNSADH